MVGELKISGGSKSVSGFHSWIQFYEEERVGRMNYYGYVRRVQVIQSRVHLSFLVKIEVNIIESLQLHEQNVHIDCPIEKIEVPILESLYPLRKNVHVDNHTDTDTDSLLSMSNIEICLSTACNVKTTT